METTVMAQKIETAKMNKHRNYDVHVILSKKTLVGVKYHLKESWKKRCEG